MNSAEAKQILLFYRPGSRDEPDAELAQAVAFAKGDPELGHWFEKHCALQAAICGHLRQIDAPVEFKERILARRIVRQRIVRLQMPVALATAAAIALFIGLAAHWFKPHKRDDSAACRDHMMGIALRGYGMDLTTPDLNEIRAYLKSHRGLADYALTRGLEKLPSEGCAVLDWHGHPVSMVCFNSGNHKDLYLFVMNRKALRDGLLTDQPQFNQVSTLMTATWAAAGKVYFLAGKGDQEFLRKFL